MTWAVRPRSLTGGFALAAMSLVATPLLQQPSFRADVRAVPVYATVRDASGRFVPDLHADAFEVFEDGRRQPISVFSRDPQPLSVAIMLDAGVFNNGTFSPLLTAVLAFMKGLRPDDRASIGTFGLEIAVGANLTSNRAELARVLQEEIWVGGGTPLWQAVRAATTSLSQEPGRRVVLLLADGYDTGSIPGYPGGRAEAERQALETDCMVYAVSFENPSRGFPKGTLDLLTATGGGHFAVSSQSDFSQAVGRLAEELRHQYLIGFVPEAADGQPHRLEVRMVQRDLKASARTSFVAAVAR